VTAPASPESHRLRLTIIGLVAVSLFAALLARLWYLQVIGAPQAQAAAQSNGVRIVTTPAARGRILDRNGTIIVDNKMSEVVTISRNTAKKEPDVMARLAALFGLSQDAIQRKVNDVRYSPYVPVPVAVDVTPLQVIYIKEHQPDFAGVDVASMAERTYPNGNMAANVIGYVGQITDRELASRKRLGYQQGEQMGQTGVEAAYEDALRGQPGVTKLQVDSRGRVLGTLASQPPVQGRDVWLSIDLRIQKLAEDSLTQGLAAARLTTDNTAGPGKGAFLKATAGAATVMDPNDGSILALASNPTYAPADFVNGISSAKFAGYSNDPNNPLSDRTIQGLYAPGSTFKLVTAIAGLQAGIVSPNVYFNDKGYLQVGKTRFKNDNGQIFGEVNLQRAITVSSDAYFYNIGATFWNNNHQYGPDGLQNVARQLGFGAQTGIPLPDEAAGRIPDKALRAQEHAQNPKAFPEGGWFTGDNVNTSIGQGEVAVTPLQLANAYAAFANGGSVWQPRIAIKITDQAGGVIRILQPQLAHKVDLAPQVRDPILAGLQGVTADSAGTAHAAFAGFPLGQFPVAGKTGTAQVTGKQATSVFVAFAPANSPRYVVDSFIEQGGYGASASAPVVRRIYDGLFNQTLQNVSAKSGVD
jgi:penicillin-binding protein 2